MPKRKSSSTISSPTPLSGASLPHSTVIPFSPDVKRLLSRLPKTSLLGLVDSWLSDERITLFAPDFYDPDEDELDIGEGEEDERTQISVEEARAVYRELGERKEMRAKDVVLRMGEYEWRHGITLLAVAEIDWVCLLTRPASAKWTTLSITPLTTATLPPKTSRFHPATFTATLTSTLHPLFIPHLTLFSHPSLPLHILRISLHPPSTTISFPAPRHSFWLSFPSSAHTHIFTTLGLRRSDGLREAVIAGIAAGLSREGQRFEVRNDRFVAKTLESMVYHRGTGGGSGGCVAGWGMYVDGFEVNPLALPKEVVASLATVGEGDRRDPEIDTDAGGEEGKTRKRRKILADTRFGDNTSLNDGRAVESVTFRLEEPVPDAVVNATSSTAADDEDDESDNGDYEDGVWRPDITVTFEGPHVFAGLKSLAENGAGVVVEKLPGWMVGEAMVTSGVVRGGKVLHSGVEMRVGTGIARGKEVGKEKEVGREKAKQKQGKA